ncbi:MAG: hypothetical protein E3J72_13845 [Planctomycetota bacterium]|nr:MAG: hypothetical protein E3J72_13845 [Planctomycetota bacterium]
MLKRIRFLLFFAALLGLFMTFNSSSLVLAEDEEEDEKQGEKEGDKPPEQDVGENPDFYARRGIKKADVDAAVEKACAFLKAGQQADGSIPGPSGTQAANYPMGSTALACFALLKGGVPRTDPVIQKGLKFCREHWSASADHPDANKGGNTQGRMMRPSKTYSISCLILALEAWYAPRPPKTKKEKQKSMTAPYEERVKKNFARFAGAADKKLMKELVDWLLSKQERNIWRYPGKAGNSQPVEDASNTQYVALALNAARRCNVPIGKDVWKRMADYFIREQDKDGPEVKPFRVPGADSSIRNLKREGKRIMKELKKAFKKEARKARSKKDKDEEKGDMDSGPRTAPVDEKKLFGNEKHEMKARGWSYVTKSAPKDDPKSFTVTSGSMTTSGVAALMIAKAALEGYGGWKSGYGKKGNQAIRDGCAWLARNFSATMNPSLGQHYHLYYLYGLERAGVLSLCMQLGAHDWYAEGAKWFLANQSGDGHWPGDSTCGDIANTCFGILFLKRATTPVIELPRDTFTGASLFNPKKKDENVARPGK